jgi:hypothetical protein
MSQHHIFPLLLDISIKKCPIRSRCERKVTVGLDIKTSKQIKLSCLFNKSCCHVPFHSLQPICDGNSCPTFEEYCSFFFKFIIFYCNKISVFTVYGIVQQCYCLRTIETTFSVVKILTYGRTPSFMLVPSSANTVISLLDGHNMNVHICRFGV